MIAVVLTAVLITLGLILIGAGQAEVTEPGQIYTESEAASISNTDALEVLQQSYRDVAQSVLPVVVEINVTDTVKQQMPDFGSPFEFFFGPQQEGQPREREFKRSGLGSGVIVKRVGNSVFVLSNNHVVGEADEIVVTLHDKRRFEASLIGKDPRKDIALVKFETDEAIPVASFGNSDQVQVGDIVFAVGNPLGFESTITSGIVSAVGRRPEGGPVAGFTDYIQTDAAINQGNSGGALVNLRGEVIGINTWISSPNGGNVGLGFTIPINNAKQVIEDLVAKGSVDYGWLGINITDPTDDLREEMGFGDEKGAFVSDVFKGSPADKAGLLPGDFIVRINDRHIEDASDLIFTVADLPVGERAAFEFVRGGKDEAVEVKIALRKDEKIIQKQHKNLWPGMSVVRINEDIQEQLDLPDRKGNLVISNVAPDGPAGTAGFTRGDVIREINGKPVKGLQEFYRVLSEDDAKELVFRIYRGGNELILGLIRT
jgi:Do/DeqQ family serine protease